MNDSNFAARFHVEQTPEEVFDAINDVRSWWSGQIEGDTDRLGAEFTYRYKHLHYSRQKLAELVPGEKIVWHVVDGRLSFVEEGGEWKDTVIVFDIARKDGGTDVSFTHIGLTPACACYGACSGGWNVFIHGNLRNRILTGKAQPDPIAAAA